RVNLKVYMLAAWGGKLRFQAMSPNESTAADLASDGKTYCFMDVNANCGECGPATPNSVASLIRIPLHPDQVVAVLLGSAPVLDGTATLAWKDDGGREVLSLAKDGWTEQIELDGTDRRWDVLAAELKGPDGKVAWTLQHKDFHDVGGVRLPGASLFEQEGDTVRILWKDQSVGAAIPAAKFHFTPPAGLPVCQRRERRGPAERRRRVPRRDPARRNGAPARAARLSASLTSPSGAAEASPAAPRRRIQHAASRRSVRPAAQHSGHGPSAPRASARSATASG